MQAVEDPLACDSCQISLANFCNILTLLSVYDKIDSENEILDNDQIKQENIIDIETEFMEEDGFEIFNKSQNKNEESNLKLADDLDFEEWVEFWFYICFAN